ncbi:MAG TPA: hypothetical protein VG755_30585 [Nannocystaceae bacterium]|nr:hypothetical protein [Nannocystaceae bacterium]
MPAASTVGGWSSGDGSGTTSSAPGSTSTSSDTSSSTSSESSSTSTTSTSSASSSTGASAPPRWVATIAPDSTLRAIDLDDGTVVDVCTLAGIDDPDGLAFLPDDRLVGAHANELALWIADPCDCTVAFVPALEPPLALHAIAETDDNEPTIVGADASRGALFGVQVDLPQLLPLGELPIASSITALASSPDQLELHALAVLGEPQLLRIAPASGTVTSQLAIDIPASATGLTRAPDGSALIACDDTGALWRIDPDDASVTLLDAALPDPCRTLATAHAEVACIVELLDG